MFILGFISFSLRFIVRIIQFKRFKKDLSILCHMYDWEVLEKDPEKFIDILLEGNYSKAEWSAYNFLLLKGPTPWKIFISFKEFDIYNFYNKELVDKVKNKVI